VSKEQFPLYVMTFSSCWVSDRVRATRHNIGNFGGGIELLGPR